MNAPIKQLNATKSDMSVSQNDILDVCGFGIIILDEYSRLVHWNKWVSEHCDFILEEKIGEFFEVIFPVSNQIRLLNAIDDALHYHLPSALSHKLTPHPLSLVNAKGSLIEHSTRITPLEKPNGTIHCLIEINDVSAIIKREKQLRVISTQMRHEKEWADVTLMSIADAVITTCPKGIIIAANQRAEKITGFKKDKMVDQPISKICQFEQDVEDLTPHPVIACLQEKFPITDTDNFHFISADSLSYAVNLSIAPIIDVDGILLGSVMTFRDITDSRNISAQLAWQAKHDHLTGLLNRRELEAQLSLLLEDAIKNNNHHYLMYIDLDQFKIINDTCGHGVGDKLLRQISHVLQEQLRQDDILARIGGDEFCVILPNCPAENALKISNILRQSVLNHRFFHEDKPYALGASIGLTAISGAEKNSAEILSAADSACYVAKSLGRNRVHLHNLLAENTLQPQKAMQWFSRLQEALDENRFVLHAQEIISINSNHSKEEEAKHYEVLIRMLDKDGDIIPPNSFIPAAERFHLMQRIDRWVLKHVCEYLAKLQVLSKGLPIISVNLSGTSVSDSKFLQETLELFEKHNTPAKHICFEITETATISNLKDALAFMNEMKTLGCKISLDDFGSGLSSFAYLKDMPVDYLKIDGHFIKNITDDERDKAFVSAIHQIAKVMNIQTVAEFVENDQILNTLKKLGVDYAQGYGIAKPIPLDDIEI